MINISIVEGEEVWHCLFKYDTHPVNKKFFRMSGQPVEKSNAI